VVPVQYGLSQLPQFTANVHIATGKVPVAFALLMQSTDPVGSKCEGMFHRRVFHDAQMEREGNQIRRDEYSWRVGIAEDLNGRTSQNAMIVRSFGCHVSMNQATI
jgi:hypothetical protein